MGFEGRVLEKVGSATKHAKGRDAEILSRKRDKETLKRALADMETADFLKLCFGIIEREYYSPETTKRLIESAKSLLDKITEKGYRFEKREEKENYHLTTNELSNFRKTISRLDKRKKSNRQEYKEKTGLTLEKMIQVMESLLENESIPENTRAEIGSLSMAVAAIKVLLAQ